MKKIIQWLFIFFIAISGIRYYLLNNTDRYLITEYDVTINEPMDMDKLTYTILGIKNKKEYSESYKQDVIRYTIRFKAENKTESNRDLSIYKKLALISGGTSWWIDPIENLENLRNEKVLLTLKPNESTMGEVWIDVVPDKEGFYTENVLKDADIYYIEHFHRGAYKYHLLY
ncbi:hypothetical protein [Vagococcus fessus]|uniref:DUF4352 domain-containing protein n=1 Tax=Vagococcus fessus TaxID=120370 RepID=A0A430AC37_9ENTE|nr:hypothetical protein [Vagococcus fessus]RSU04774.1 hypothetical protein CBF31_01775 [Vagococcus fessus]